MKSFKSYNFLALTASIFLGSIITYLEYQKIHGNVLKETIGLYEAWQINPPTLPDLINSASNDRDFGNIGNINTTKVYNKRLKVFINDMNKWSQTFVQQAFQLTSNANQTASYIFNSKDTYPSEWKDIRDIHLENSSVNTLKAKLIKKSQNIDNDEILLFNKFLGYLLNHKLGQTESFKNHSEYSEACLRTFLSDDSFTKQPLIYQNLKVFHIYLVNKKIVKPKNQSDSIQANLILYPATNEDFNGLVPWERQWWKAAFEEENSRSFPFDFKRAVNSNSFKSGLTNQYTDIQTEGINSLNVRTFFVKFITPKLSNKEHVIGVDLFFENESIGKGFYGIFEFGLCPTISYLFSLTGLYIFNNYLGFIFDFTLFSLLLFGLFYLSKNRIINYLDKFSEENYTSKFFQFDLYRTNGRFDYKKDNLGSIVQTYNNKIGETKTNYNEIILNIDFKGAIFKTSSRLQNDQSTNNEMSFSYKIDTSLGIDGKNYYRAIEIWKIKDKDNQDLGTFIVKWLNTIYAKDELSIDLIGPLNNYMNDNYFKKVYSNLKKQFEAHLLGSEHGFTQIRINKDYTPSMEADIPKILHERKVGGHSLLEHFQSKGKGLLERKIVFKRDTDNLELKFFMDLYKKVTIQAICNIHFLNSLDGDLDEFIRATFDRERFYIESRENEFLDFFSLQPEIVQNLLISRSEQFKIWKHSTDDIDRRSTYIKYDFALAKDGSDYPYVIYSYNQGVTNEIGWLSWRDVDIIFYQNVFLEISDFIKEKCISIKKYLSE